MAAARCVSSSVSSVFNYSYLAGSDLISGHTLSSTPSALSVSRTYEPNRDLITQVKNQFDTTTISQYNYTNDELGRRTDRIDTMATATTNTFGYNTRSELTNAVMGTDDFAYDYDPIGNRRCSSRSVSGISTTNNYTANSMNQYSSINGTNLTYDGDGNMLTHNDWTYTWNGENRLVNASNSTTQISYSYDYMGRRFQKVTTTASETVTNQFIYDGWNLISDLRSPSSGTSSTNWFVWGLDLSGSMQGAGGIGGLLSVTECSVGSTNQYFPAFDANGNVSDYVTTNGTIVAHYEYNPFGGTISSTGTKADDFKFRFSTKYFETETGLYYYGYRYYNPELGRWPSRDPIGEYGGLNMYGFVQNDSVNQTDSRGLEITITKSKDLNAAPHKNGYRGWTSFTGRFKVKCKFIFWLDVTGSLDLKQHLLVATHALWNVRLSRYAAKWGSPRNNATERAATLAHEDDHYKTWEKFLEIVKELNAMDGKCMWKCASKAAELEANLEKIMKEAKAHSGSFHDAVWIDGGNYSRHPFVPTTTLE